MLVLLLLYSMSHGVFFRHDLEEMQFHFNLDRPIRHAYNETRLLFFDKINNMHKLEK